VPVARVSPARPIMSGKNLWDISFLNAENAEHTEKIINNKNSSYFCDLCVLCVEKEEK
jgi:hypothetical protein